jgi:hypothetical protein
MDSDTTTKWTGDPRIPSNGLVHTGMQFVILHYCHEDNAQIAIYQATDDITWNCDFVAVCYSTNLLSWSADFEFKVSKGWSYQPTP